jgi:hypothetical protein
VRIAAKVRLEKEQHPERFCSEPKCLWRIWTRDGAKPCANHMGAGKIAGRAPLSENGASPIQETPRAES